MTLKKYFIAIVIPMPLLGEIEAIKQGLQGQHGLKGALRSPAHITLHRPFEWKEEKEAELIKKLSDFKFPVPTQIQLKDFAFFEPRVIFVNVLPNETLHKLHEKLTGFAKRELKLFNEAEDLRGFHPHVTVAFRDLKKPKFYALQKEFEEKKLEGSFNYTGFSLLKLEERWKEIVFF
jgi:2'-5' RNA ligase